MGELQAEGAREMWRRVQAIRGPDREVDGALHNFLFGTEYVKSIGSVTGFMTSATNNGCPTVPDYTASLDAAVGLINAALPGWGWGVSDYQHTPAGTCSCFLHPKPEQPFCHHDSGKTPALAICAAILWALINEDRQP